MERNKTFSNPKSMLILVACICFAIAVLETAGFFSINKVDWTNLGLLFGLPLVHRLISRPRRFLVKRFRHGIQDDWPLDEMSKSPGA